MGTGVLPCAHLPGIAVVVRGAVIRLGVDEVHPQLRGRGREGGRAGERVYRTGVVETVCTWKAMEELHGDNLTRGVAQRAERTGRCVQRLAPAPWCHYTGLLLRPLPGCAICYKGVEEEARKPPDVLHAAPYQLYGLAFHACTGPRCAPQQPSCCRLALELALANWGACVLLALVHIVLASQAPDPK